MNMDISIRKKVMLIFSLTECLVFAGPTFGWASFVYVLRDRGYFSDFCSNDTEIDENETFDVNISNSASSHETCAKQDSLFQLVFIIGAFGVNSSSLLLGPVYDKFGTRITRIIASIFVTSSCLFFALSKPSMPYLLFPALHLLANGGILIIITSFQIGNLFGNNRSTVVTLHSGAMGSSAIVMLFIKIAYTKGITMMTSFLFLAGLALFFNINTFCFLPKYKIPWPLPNNWGHTDDSLDHDQVKNSLELEPMEIKDPGIEFPAGASSSWMDVEFYSLSSCFKSAMFVLFLFWFSIIQLIHLFYIGTFNPRFQLLTNDNPNLISKYTTGFTAIQASGVLFAPLCGLVMDRNKKSGNKNNNKYGREGSGNESSLDDLQDCILAIILTNIITAVFSVTMTIPVLALQYLTFLLQVIGRTFLYGVFASFVSVTFPGRYFGSIYGVISITAAFIALLQFPLFKIVQHFLDSHTLYVDLFLLLVNICTLIQPFYVYTFVSKRRHTPITIDDEALFDDGPTEANHSKIC